MRATGLGSEDTGMTTKDSSLVIWREKTRSREVNQVLREGGEMRTTRQSR